MSSNALSKRRLDRVHEVLAAHVGRGTASGLVALVARRDATWVDAIGTSAVGGGSPVQRDSIFRVASMTKPVCAVAALILVEDGVLRLDDPVDDLLPELANRRVLVDLEGPLDNTVPANRSITLRDLLTFRLGQGLYFGDLATPYMQKLVELNFLPGPPQPANEPSGDDFMAMLGELPLLHQPGEQWLYNTGMDVAGVLIERATGSSLGAFMRERIFEPLGMNDTGFVVPADQLGRLTTSYTTNPESGALDLWDEPNGGWSTPPRQERGAGGLVSSVDDFLRFGKMLLGMGALGATRVLSRLSVETMTTDQLTREQKERSGAMLPGFFDDNGWGFGVSMVTRNVDPAQPVGTYGWDGGLGTLFKVYPSEDMVSVLLTNASWSSPIPPPIARDFWATTAAAIND
jgi:CubicO group peptidase (beta-lactamase class C family)